MAELQASVDAYFRDSDYGLVGQYREGRKEYVYALKLPPTFPLEWGLMVGEYAHQLRSALDNLMWQLVLHRGGTPTRRTQFPIFTRRARYRTIGRVMIDGVGRGDRGTIEQLQPYKWRLANAHPLAMLGWISNIDKHRIVHATNVHLAFSDEAFDPNTGEFRYEPNDDAGEVLKFTMTRSARSDNFADGLDVFRFRLEPTGPKPAVRLIGFTSGIGVTFTERYFGDWAFRRIKGGVEEVFDVLGPKFDA